MKALTHNDVEIGDWVVQDFEIKQVREKRPEYDSLTLSTGIISSSGNFDDAMFPLTLQSKVIAYSIEKTMDQIRDIHRNLNFPDIRRKMESFFIEACSLDSDSKTYDDDMRAMWDKIADFKLGIQELIDDTKSNTVQGVSILRN